MNKARKMLFSIAVALSLVCLGTIGTMQKVLASSTVTRSCEGGEYCWGLYINDNGDLAYGDGICAYAGLFGCACLFWDYHWKEGCS